MGTAIQLRVTASRPEVALACPSLITSRVARRHPSPPPVKCSQPPKNGLTAAQLQALKNAAKLDAGVCANAFSPAMSSVGQRFSLKAFDSQIQSIRYNQYPDVATNPLGPLSSVEARALKNSINLYPNFFTDTSTRQAGIAVHENLHVYTGWNDSNVFYMFQTVASCRTT